MQHKYRKTKQKKNVIWTKQPTALGMYKKQKNCYNDRPIAQHKTVIKKKPLINCTETAGVFIFQLNENTSNKHPKQFYVKIIHIYIFGQQR